VRATIKRLIDAFRGREGYAGMAVYRDGLLLFYDVLDPDLANRSKRLFEESEVTLKASSMAAIVRGFTIAAFRAGSLLVVCRFEGRFTRPPVPVEEETEYAMGQQPAQLLTREEAKREAELLLRRLMSME
jgi:hypothetical protein